MKTYFVLVQLYDCFKEISKWSFTHEEAGNVDHKTAFKNAEKYAVDNSQYRAVIVEFYTV